MCLFWTMRYTLCGCISDRATLACIDKSHCFGPRMIMVESHTATCAECWTRGDKRVNRDHKSNTDNLEWKEFDFLGYRIPKSKTNWGDSDSEDGDIFFDALEFQPTFSRPSTPIIHAKINPSSCPVSEDNYFDLDRVCDPVKLTSVRWDSRARLQRKRNALSTERGLEFDTDSIASFTNHVNEQDKNLEIGTTYEDSACVEAFNEPDQVRNSHFGIIGSHSRSKTAMEHLEDESLEFYGIRKEY
ncbi:unnamed protein product [Penicillium salamii]|nr:unnamed protein product [Penicillium salamii]CAG8155516.1 unnamed protein product [Penicillium salamii]CAG8381051.1 unnamed protein product [Penicillium salamii]